MRCGDKDYEETGGSGGYGEASYDASTEAALVHSVLRARELLEEKAQSACLSWSAREL